MLKSVLYVICIIWGVLDVMRAALVQKIMYETPSPIPITYRSVPSLANGHGHLASDLRSCSLFVHKPHPVDGFNSQDMQELVTSMLHKDARQRPSILQILKCSFLQAYISQLLSYTIRKGQ